MLVTAETQNYCRARNKELPTNYCVFTKLHSALAKQHLERLQKSLFETEKSKFVHECKQISDLQIISFVVVPCQVKIFLNFPFFTVYLLDINREQREYRDRETESNERMK
jgi:hypothetical protein